MYGIFWKCYISLIVWISIPKSEEESLTKICVSFVEINTDTECTGGRVGLMHQIANLAYMRIHVTWGRSPPCTLNVIKIN